MINNYSMINIMLNKWDSFKVDNISTDDIIIYKRVGQLFDYAKDFYLSYITEKTVNDKIGTHLHMTFRLIDLVFTEDFPFVSIKSRSPADGDFLTLTKNTLNNKQILETKPIKFNDLNKRFCFNIDNSDYIRYDDIKNKDFDDVSKFIIEYLHPMLLKTLNDNITAKLITTSNEANILKNIDYFCNNFYHINNIRPNYILMHLKNENLFFTEDENINRRNITYNKEVHYYNQTFNLMYKYKDIPTYSSLIIPENEIYIGHCDGIIYTPYLPIILTENFNSVYYSEAVTVFNNTLFGKIIINN